MTRENRSTLDTSFTHTYLREILENDRVEDSLRLLVNSIEPGLTVLDVGTGSGSLGRFLTTQLHCTVDGITYNAEEAAAAQPHYRDILLVDLEQQPIPALISKRRYDVIVCADVLEHLRNAESVLAGLGEMLAPDGKILLSVPNVTHMGVLLGLLAGRFGRTHEGLLDATHVHFFDRKELADLCVAAGYSIDHEDAVRRNLLDTEFARLDFQSFPRSVRQFVQSLPDAEVYQFIWRLRPRNLSAEGVAVHGKPPTPQLSPVVVVPKFGIQLYVDHGKGYLEEESIHAYGVQELGLQSLKFEIPRSEQIRAIRIDFGDRIGAFEFAGLRAFDPSGREVWSWAGDWCSRMQLNDCMLTAVQGRHGGHIVRSTGHDPWVSLPIDPREWAQVSSLQVLMSCPAAYADALFLTSDRMAADFLHSLEKSDARVEILSAQINGLAKSIQQTTQLNERLTHELLLARSQLAEIRSSTSWRVTAGLRAVSRWINKLRS